MSLLVGWDANQGAAFTNMRERQYSGSASHARLRTLQSTLLMIVALCVAPALRAQPGSTDYSKATTKTLKLRGNFDAASYHHAGRH